uniref:Carboxypeptidase n=1 Tax=Arcella intermedia TaxID=1963864 RepID=A0A6B2L4B6_9EUKA
MILSDYLPNDPKTARTLSMVNVSGYKYPSYSGYFRVNNEYNSNMFFWYFQAETNYQDAPVVVWLQGGPGASSMFGLFGENGPFSVDSDGKTLLPSQYRWTQYFNMIYLDNPVGVGFSFTESTSGFVNNEDQVGANIVSVFQQFFQVFDDIKGNDFYIAGESYGGKYTPAAAYAIHMANQASPYKINLKGVSIGDGLVDPGIQMNGYADLALQLDLCDQYEYLVIKDYETRVQAAIKEGRARDGFMIFDEFLNGDFYPYHTYFYNITGDANYFNLNDPNYPPNPYPDYLSLQSTKDMLHTGTYPFYDYNSTVEYHLIEDWMYSVKPHVEFLLNEGYKVLVYNGQFDIILAGPRARVLCDYLVWDGQQGYQQSKKVIWKVEPTDTTPAGYVHNYQNLWRAIVRAAGHMVPADQPRAALDMMLRFYNNIPFNK